MTFFILLSSLLQLRRESERVGGWALYSQEKSATKLIQITNLKIKYIHGYMYISVDILGCFLFFILDFFILYMSCNIVCKKRHFKAFSGCIILLGKVQPVNFAYLI